VVVAGVARLVLSTRRGSISLPGRAAAV